jgi:hypothetical protein
VHGEPFTGPFPSQPADLADSGQNRMGMVRRTRLGAHRMEALIRPSPYPNAGPSPCPWSTSWPSNRPARLR